MSWIAGGLFNLKASMLAFAQKWHAALLCFCLLQGSLGDLGPLCWSFLFGSHCNHKTVFLWLASSPSISKSQNSSSATALQVNLAGLAPMKVSGPAEFSRPKHGSIHKIPALAPQKEDHPNVNPPMSTSKNV